MSLSLLSVLNDFRSEAGAEIEYTECKYGGPLGRPGTSSMEARPVSMSVAAFP